MNTLREYLQESGEKKIAIGHFNVSDLIALHAIVDAARELGVEGSTKWGEAVPILIGVSEGEREFFGVQEVATLVKLLREKYQQPIFLNADHTHSLKKIEEAVRAGFDEVLIDGSKLSFGENVKLTKQAVELAKSIDPEIIVEGEIGYIGSSSEILEETPEGASLSKESLTTPEQAAQFIQETDIDVLAPAVGNMHGLLASMVKGEVHKRLDLERIGDIKRETNSYMTLHGGSGTQDEDFVAAIKTGMNIVHVNTEIRLAWRRGLEESLQGDSHEVAPYKLLQSSYEKIKQIVSERLKLFAQK